jgi:predicted nuclease with RNAse H fold
MPTQSHAIANPSLPILLSPSPTSLRAKRNNLAILRTGPAKQHQLFFGIDLTSTTAKPSACLALDDKLQLIYFGFIATDDDIITIQNLYSPQVIAIDAPLSLPLGLCCLERSCPCQPKSSEKNRKCDRELRHRGIPCYPTTKETFIKELIYRGISLKNKLCQQGFNVIEVYPYATNTCLFGKAIPRKTTPEGISFLKQRLANLLPTLSPYLELFDHNLCDAATAAYTAFLYHQNMAEALGDAGEGLIFIPKASQGKGSLDFYLPPC